MPPQDIQLDQDILARVIRVVANNLEIDPAKIDVSSRFAEDLDADSMERVMLVVGFEDEFRIRIPEEVAVAIRTVGDATRALRVHLRAQ